MDSDLLAEVVGRVTTPNTQQPEDNPHSFRGGLQHANRRTSLYRIDEHGCIGKCRHKIGNAEVNVKLCMDDKAPGQEHCGINHMGGPNALCPNSLYIVAQSRRPKQILLTPFLKIQQLDESYVEELMKEKHDPAMWLMIFEQKKPC